MPERHEHQVALAVDAEAAHHVVDGAELGLAHAAVARQPAFGEHRLRHAGLGGHHDVALEHAAVELVLGVAPHEIGAHPADQRRQRPDARPFAHRVGQRGLVGGEVAGEHVVHVGAVVHDEHHRGVGLDARQVLGVDVPQPHAVQQLRHALADPVADAEVQVGVERRHGLAGVALDALVAVRSGMRCPWSELLRRLLHLRVGQQAVDQRLAAGALERADADAQALADLVDHLVGRAHRRPAQQRHQRVLVQRPDCERSRQRRQPERDRYRSRSSAACSRAQNR